MTQQRLDAHQEQVFALLMHTYVLPCSDAVSYMVSGAVSCHHSLGGSRRELDMLASAFMEELLWLAIKYHHQRHVDDACFLESVNRALTRWHKEHQRDNPPE